MVDNNLFHILVNSLANQVTHSIVTPVRICHSLISNVVWANSVPSVNLALNCLFPMMLCQWHVQMYFNYCTILYSYYLIKSFRPFHSLWEVVMLSQENRIQPHVLVVASGQNYCKFFFLQIRDVQKINRKFYFSSCFCRWICIKHGTRQNYKTRKSERNFLFMLMFSENLTSFSLYTKPLTIIYDRIYNPTEQTNKNWCLALLNHCTDPK